MKCYIADAEFLAVDTGYGLPTFTFPSRVMALNTLVFFTVVEFMNRQTHTYIGHLNTST